MPLSLEILSLIVNNLRNDQGTLSSCSLAFRTLSTIASAHLLRRRVFLVDVDKSPVSMLIQQLEESVRLRMVEELHLVRKEPDEEVGEDSLPNHGLQKPGTSTAPKNSVKVRNSKKKPRQTKGDKGTKFVVTAPKRPKVPPPPPQGHINNHLLHTLLCRLPKLRSLRITRLHVVPGAPFDISPRFNLEELHFLGLDTANAFHSTLALFSSIKTLTVSDQWNYFVVPVGPAKIPNIFPYVPEPPSSQQQPLELHTLKIADCMPTIMTYWFKACKVFVTPFANIKRLVLDDSLLLFKEDRLLFNAALREICEHVECIDLDLTPTRPIVLPTEPVLFPALRHASALTSVHIAVRSTKGGFITAQKFLLSLARDTGDGPSAPPLLREIHLTLVFWRMVDRWGDPEEDEDTLIRLQSRNWVHLNRALKGLGWTRRRDEDGLILEVRMLDGPEKDGGRVWLRDELKEVLQMELASNVFPILRCG